MEINVSKINDKGKIKGFKEKLKSFLVSLKKIPWLLGERVFSFFLTAILLAIIVSALFFFKSIVLTQRQTLSVPPDLPVFGQEALDKIKQHWQDRRQKLEAADTTSYPDLFSPKGE
ncbi:MAG: hypothetical protein HY577_00215 [Candidatus Nealsonbacteria bacterium]|nr:hypothetical protein [Candidatus Nealsonbacteria bacterium]